MEKNLIYAQGIAFADGIPLFEAQEIIFNLGMTSLTHPKGDGGGNISVALDAPITGRIAFSGLNPLNLAALTGASSVTGSWKRIRNEKLTKATNDLTTSETPVANTVIVIPDGANKEALKKVASAPALGEYSISGSTITLNASQTETDFYVSYFYLDGANGETLQFGPDAIPSEFELYASIRKKGIFGAVSGDLIVYAPNCTRIDGEIGIGGAVGSVGSPGFDFNVIRNVPTDFQISFE